MLPLLEPGNVVPQSNPARVRSLATHIDQLVDDLAVDPVDAAVACLFACAVRSRDLTPAQRAEVIGALRICEAHIGGGPGPVAVSAIPS